MVVPEEAVMMTLRRIMVAGLPLALLTDAAAWAAPNYIATPLRLGGIYSTANGINTRGVVTGCLGSGSAR